jgi:hypothetical protein
MSLDELRWLLESGTFHHATYRCEGTLWEGLWVYKHDANGFCGYSPAGAILKDSPDLDEAYRLVSPTGISRGAYGGG